MRIENTELSYIDLISGLYEDVMSDAIPEKQKEKIIKLISKLAEELGKYSA